MQHPEGPTRGTDRHLYTPVHSSATQHRPKWNPTPTDGWTDEQCGPSIQQNTIQPREENSDMLQHEPRRHYAKWRKPGTKGQYCKIPLIGGPQSDQIQRQKTIFCCIQKQFCISVIMTPQNDKKNLIQKKAQQNQIHSAKRYRAINLVTLIKIRQELMKIFPFFTF